MKTVDTAIKLLANIINGECIYYYMFGDGRDSDIDKSFNNTLNNFCNELKIEIEKEIKDKSQCIFFCNGYFMSGLDKFPDKEKYEVIYKFLPEHVKIAIADDYVYDFNSEFPHAPKEKLFIACSKDYALGSINFYKNAEKNHSYGFDEAKEQIKDWEDFLKKFDSKDFYIREDLRDSDSGEKEEITENDDTGFEDSTKSNFNEGNEEDIDEDNDNGNDDVE